MKCLNHWFHFIISVDVYVGLSETFWKTFQLQGHQVTSNSLVNLFFSNMELAHHPPSPSDDEIPLDQRKENNF